MAKARTPKRRNVVYETLDGQWFGYAEATYRYFVGTHPTEEAARAAVAAVPEDVIR